MKKIINQYILCDFVERRNHYINPDIVLITTLSIIVLFVSQILDYLKYIWTCVTCGHKNSNAQINCNQRIKLDLLVQFIPISEDNIFQLFFVYVYFNEKKKCTTQHFISALFWLEFSCAPPCFKFVRVVFILYQFFLWGFLLFILLN